MNNRISSTVGLYQDARGWVAVTFDPATDTSKAVRIKPPGRFMERQTWASVAFEIPS